MQKVWDTFSHLLADITPDESSSGKRPRLDDHSTGESYPDVNGCRVVKLYVVADLNGSLWECSSKADCAERVYKCAGLLRAMKKPRVFEFVHDLRADLSRWRTLAQAYSDSMVTFDQTTDFA